MTTQSRLVRVFLSSTFRDFAEERDLLVRKVFPELRRQCRARQVELVDVDLRWGITEEEAQQGRVLPICLAEIDRSRPFFMGFIGERYGWVPEAEKYDLSLIMEQPWLDEHRGGKSVTELEMLHGVLNNPAMEDRAFFYFRDAAYSNSKGGAYLSESKADKAKLEALKDRIRKSGYPVVENYPSPEALAERVKEDLWRLIDEAFPENEVPDALVQERMRHEQFAASRLGLYLGGEGYFAALDAAMSVDPCRPVLVTGASGGGKSALLANWMERFSKQNPEAFVLFHFLAVGADAAHPVGLATRLLKEISRFTGEELVLEGDPRKALHMLSTWLEKAGAFAKENGKIFILMVDALDKLSDTRNLDWWPRKLPDGVRLVVSCLDGEVLDAARTRMHWSEVNVSPLGADDRSKFVEDYFGKYRKSLPAEQKALVLEHALSGNPLFLRTLLEELRVFGVHEELQGRLEHYLACETVDDLFERVLERIESDNTPDSVRAVLEVLWAAKESFAEDELLEVTGLPPAIWAPIHIALDESLIGGGGRLAFSHDYLRKAVQDRYLAEEKDRKRIRNKLAEFCASGMESGRKELSPYIRRHAVEHFLETQDWDNATAELSDLEFIEARAIAQELPAMLKDYAEAVKLLPEGEKERQTEAARQAELDRYAKEMYEYSAIWSRIRDGSGEAEPQLPRPVRSVRLWTSEEIALERKRITETPNRLDIVKAFRIFVATNSAPLQNYSSQEGFAANLARNDAPAGPVHEEGKRRLEPLKCVKLIKHFAPDEIYNPLPACRAVLEGHTYPISSIVITANNRRVVSGSWDNTLRMWDMESGDCLKVFEGHEHWVNCIALTSDGKRIVSGSGDKTLRVWDMESGECLRLLEGHTSGVYSLVLSVDGHLAVSGSDDRTLRVWNLKSGECIKVLEGHTDDISSLVLSADGHLAVSGSRDTTLRVWNLKSGECLKVLEGHTGSVKSLVLSADGRQVLSGGWDQSLRVWDVEGGTCLKVHEGHKKWYRSPLLSPDGKRVVWGILGNRLLVWDIESEECLKVLEGHTSWVESIALSIDGKLIVSGCRDNILRLWDMESGECLKVPDRHATWVTFLMISGNGRRAISRSNDKTLKIWDMESRECLKVIKHKKPTIMTLVASADGLIGFCKSRNTIEVLDIESGECLMTLNGHMDDINCIALGYDGRRAVSGSKDKTLRVWDMESGECLKVLEGHTGGISSIVISGDGRRVISGSGDKSLRIWDGESGECLKVLKGHTDDISSLVLSANGRHIVSKGGGEQRVWDMESGDCLLVLEVHMSEDVNRLGVSADGRLAVSESWNEPLRVLDIESGKCFGVFFLRGKFSVELDSRTGRLMVGFYDGRVEFYNLENLPFGPFITTAHREILSEDLPAGPVTARPACCGQLISIPSTIADRIEHWALDGGEGGYTDPDLLLDCPNCSTPLRMNPFFVDIPTTASEKL